MAICADAGAVRCEVERREAPGERVVEVVDQPGLAAGAQDRVAQARVREGAAQARARDGIASPCACCSSATCAPVSRTANDADQQAGRGDQRRADPDDRPRRVAGGERAGDEGGGGDAEVAGRLVEAEREPAPPRPGEVDLHHHRHRPGEALVDAEQQVGGDDEPPRGREPDQQRHRQRDQPADHEQPLAPEPLGQARRRRGS